MDEIQSKYKKRKKLYLGLLASLVALVIVFRLTAPASGQDTFQANLLKLACLLVVIFAARTVFRCPNCETALAHEFYSSWCKLRRCPKCGVKLTED
jgi:Zn finger protein HypA/HybF involved in hydrogenase expression